MGYKTVAINQLFNDISMENTTSKKKKKGENKIITDIIPEPINLDNFTKVVFLFTKFISFFFELIKIIFIFFFLFLRNIVAN